MLQVQGQQWPNQFRHSWRLREDELQDLSQVEHDRKNIMTIPSGNRLPMDEVLSGQPSAWECSKDDILFKTCQIVVQWVKLHVDDRRGGLHTRIFSHILNPELDYVCAGISREALESNRSARYFEHVVPCRTLIVELRRLVACNERSADEIASMLMKHWKVALITKDQAREIDRHYKSEMPEGWTFETGDTMARLSGIELLPYTTNPVIALNLTSVVLKGAPSQGAVG